MSTIKANNAEAVYKIASFLGLNESADGDTSLKLGEASRIKNWKITRDGHLQKRFGLTDIAEFDGEIKGLWYGNVNGKFVGIAAANNKLYQFYDEETDSFEVKEIGPLNTENRVNFFPFNNIVYILNGVEYKQYNGYSVEDVKGYIPIIATSGAPSGEGSTLLEEVNKLTSNRRVWFSPDGTDNVFHLPEKDILAVHYVRNLGTDEYFSPKRYNVDRINGTVSFGQDEVITYDGTDEIPLETEAIVDVGQIQINGVVPESSYAAGDTGITFDTAPGYDTELVFTIGGDFTETFEGDGETTEFPLGNENLETLEVYLDDERVEAGTLFENHWKEHYALPPSSGIKQSLISFKASVNASDKISVTSKETAEYVDTASQSIGSTTLEIPIPDDESVDFETEVYAVSLKKDDTEIEEYEAPTFTLIPYQDTAVMDENAFVSKIKQLHKDGIVERNLAYSDYTFIYSSVYSKWALDAYFSSQTEHVSLEPEWDSIDTNIMKSQVEPPEPVLRPIAYITLLGYNADKYTLVHGRDFTYTIEELDTNYQYHITLSHTVQYYYETYFPDVTPIGGSYNGAIIFSAAVFSDYEEISDMYFDLADFGITYTPDHEIDSGDTISVDLLFHFYFEKGNRNLTLPYTTTKDTYTVTSKWEKQIEDSLEYFAPDTGSLAYSNVYTEDLDFTNIEQTELIVKLNDEVVPEYSIFEYDAETNTITFHDAPEADKKIRFEEHKAEEEINIVSDGVTTEYDLGVAGAHSISVSINENPVSISTRFSFDSDTRILKIEDNTGLAIGDKIKVKGKNPPARGTNTIEICYSASNTLSQEVFKMTNAEIFLGSQDNAVFLYGNGTNEAFYSGIDYDGKPRADYFPDLNEMAVADSNTPITALVRHYSQLLCFKSNSVYSVHHGIITTALGDEEYGFYVTPVNRAIGNAALGQVRLVLNSPFALFGNDLYEWKNTSSYSSNLTVDERQAKRISDRVYRTLATFKAEDCYCYDDNDNQEYYICYNGQALVYNYAADAWYFYDNFDVNCMCNIDEKLFIGTSTGKIQLLDETAYGDGENVIDCYWEGGSHNFGKSYMRKHMSQMFASVKQEPDSDVTITMMTDRKEEYTEKIVLGPEEVTNRVPKVKRLKLKAKKFVYLKPIIKSENNSKPATVVQLDMRISETGYAK